MSYATSRSAVCLRNKNHYLKYLIFFCVLIAFKPFANAVESATIPDFDNLRPGLCTYLSNQHDSALPLELAKNYHVHWLTSDQEKLNAFRDAALKRNQYGRIVVDHANLKALPYANNLINLVVIEDYNALSKNGLNIKEIMRVVAPLNAALIKNAPSDLKQQLSNAGYADATLNQNNNWTQIIKTWPEGMDEWSHPEYDASGTSISSDTIARPSNSVQWIAGYPGRHEQALSPLLTAGGRIFSFSLDEGIMARDAFNGSKLWQRDAAKCLIATADIIFVRLKNLGPIVALDPKTGDIIKEYTFGSRKSAWPPAARTIYQDGVLVTGIRERIEAYDVKTGEELWRQNIAGEKPKGFSKLAHFQDINKKRIIGEGKVFVTLSEKKEFVCFDLKTGKELWRVPNEGDRLVCYRKGILFTQLMTKGSNNEETVFNAAYSANDGKRLWRYDYPKVWHGGHPHNVFLLNDLVWILAAVPTEGVKFSKLPQAWHALDTKTGKLVRTVDWKNTKHYCYSDRATEQYLIAGGIDFLDVGSGKHHKFFAGKGSCSFGRMPANGMLYNGPNTCQCFSQVRGFTAFTYNDTIPSAQNLKHAVITGTGKAAADINAEDDWPAFRGDSGRNGSNMISLPDTLKVKWHETIDTRPSSPVAACGKIFSSAIDQHQVYAHDLQSGKKIWTFTAHGRVDSPPTIYKGMALFGCRDGWVYCVSSATGALIWSLQAAPYKRWLVCREQVESSWPVHGSILIENDTAYFTAGRHAQVDGGIFFYAVNPNNGELQWCKELKGSFDAEDRSGNLSNDILIYDNEQIYLKKVSFDPKTGNKSNKKVGLHSGTSGGFLTDAFTLLGGGHEMYRRWRYINTQMSGLVLSFTDNEIFGIGPEIGSNYWKFKADDPLQVFCCTKKEGFKNVLWKFMLPQNVLPKALLVTKNKVYIAGSLRDKNGENGKGLINVYNNNDGKLTQSIPIEFTPRFDGFATVKDHLILTGKNGELVCLGE